MADAIVAQLEISSRDEAIASGQQTYFTGKPCKRGHLSPRYACSRNCIPCLNDQSTSRYENNKVVELQRAAIRYQKNKEVIKAGVKRWKELNPARKKALNDRWAAENRDKVMQSRKNWEAENPEAHKAQVAAKTRRRRARKLGSIGSHTNAQIAVLLVMQKCKCASCKASIKLAYHIDHMEPLSKGGSDGIENIQLLCPPCNLRKSNKDPLVWAAENGRLL